MEVVETAKRNFIAKRAFQDLYLRVQGKTIIIETKMLAYFEGAGPPAGQPAKLSAGAEGPAPTSRMDQLQRNRDEGKQLITDEEFDIVRRVLGLQPR